MNSLHKWLIFNSFSVSVIAFLVQYYDAFNVLLTLDKTFVTFGIMGIYAACTIYLGVMRETANFEAIQFHAGRLTALGLIGTVAAIMLMLFGVQDVAQFRQHVVSEVAPVFITALFGLGFSYLLSYQAALCFGKYSDE